MVTNAPMPEQEPEDPRGPNKRWRAPVGLSIILLLVLLGLFLVHKLRVMSQIQDCVMSGRTNCAPIYPETPEK